MGFDDFDRSIIKELSNDDHVFFTCHVASTHNRRLDKEEEEICLFRNQAEEKLNASKRGLMSKLSWWLKTWTCCAYFNPYAYAVLED